MALKTAIVTITAIQPPLQVGNLPPRELVDLLVGHRHLLPAPTGLTEEDSHHPLISSSRVIMEANLDMVLLEALLDTRGQIMIVAVEVVAMAIGVDETIEQMNLFAGCRDDLCFLVLYCVCLYIKSLKRKRAKKRELMLPLTYL